MKVDSNVATAIRLRVIACAVLLVVSVVGCATGSGTDEWSRDYVSTYDRVLEATLDALEDNGFYLDDVDRERGRIRARSSARRSELEATLFVDVRQRGDRIRVEVMAQSQGMQDGRAPIQVSGIVRDFFASLDRPLEGRED